MHLHCKGKLVDLLRSPHLPMPVKMLTEAAAQSNLQMIQPGLGFERDVETSQHKGSCKRMSRDRGLLEHVTLEQAVSLQKEDGASTASFMCWQPPPELDEHLTPREPTAVSWRESGVKRFRLTSLHVAVAGLVLMRLVKQGSARYSLGRRCNHALIPSESSPLCMKPSCRVAMMM
ncbi:hypothetical protein CEUSTIGMA_g10364.t1 [Chlamydomonas eustigma]|uniref:Uncharacterized protein n=1 Tax=Chlamydomonas eustigma TaxID=1157962 RepID=A0A250XIM4_9CHLO|nr:hypothetical protein CEUSTIGMA_g10364.t1 [Chlamydomonas eustigma]|eukprot:GAX82937.1 hypothetical protein CEUSTIGMA_g10364.t1 [Chlamydomonas eustigma]